jgi:hypothetical protein
VVSKIEDEIAAQQRLVDELNAIPLPPGATSLDLLRAIYRSPSQPLALRIKAAVAALPFEHPRLSVTVAVAPDDEFARRLELCIARSAAVMERPPAPPLRTDLRSPPVQTDRRLRRI